jgi:hypothetical protein
MEWIVIAVTKGGFRPEFHSRRLLQVLFSLAEGAPGAIYVSVP